MMTRQRFVRTHSSPAGVRRKLNQMYATVSLIGATYLGLVFSSWWVFGVAWASLLALNLFGGNIRFFGSRR